MLVVERAYALLDHLLANSLEQARPERTWLISPDAAVPGGARRTDAASDSLSVVQTKGDGFLIAPGNGIRADALAPQASVLDRCPTWLAAAGCPIPAGLPGRMLDTFFEPPPSPVAIDETAVRPPANVDRDDRPDPLMPADQLLLRLLTPDTSDPAEDPRRILRVTNQCRWSLALSLLDGGETRQAAEVLAALYAALPEQPIPALQLAEALLARRRFAEAARQARQVLGLDPDQPLAHFYLGIALVRRGETEAGLAALQRAAECAPMSLGAHAWVVRVMKRLHRSGEELGPHLEAMRRIRLGREQHRARSCLGPAESEPAPPASPEPEPFADEPFDWDALDAIPDEPPRPLDLVLISALPGGGADALADRLAAAGWRGAGPEREIRDPGDALAPFAAGEDEVARISPELLFRLPRLHHYQVLFVAQPGEPVADALADRAATEGLPRDELVWLAKRFQRAVAQVLGASVHVDLLMIPAGDVADDGIRLREVIRAQVGEHRVKALTDAG